MAAAEEEEEGRNVIGDVIMAKGLSPLRLSPLQQATCESPGSPLLPPCSSFDKLPDKPPECFVFNEYGISFNRSISKEFYVQQ